MPKRPRHVLRKNAKRGAITTWCPECKRKAALKSWVGGMYRDDKGRITVKGGRKCRYCGHFEERSNGERMRLYRMWEWEQKHKKSKEGDDAT